jgi:hypothetical protein
MIVNLLNINKKGDSDFMWEKKCLPKEKKNMKLNSKDEIEKKLK